MRAQRGARGPAGARERRQEGECADGDRARAERLEAVVQLVHDHGARGDHQRDRGEDEAARNCITVRDLGSGEQQDVSRSDLTQYLQTWRRV